jgi:predicted esterase
MPPSDCVLCLVQGGTIALLMLRSDMKFAGIVGLSTYLSLRNDTLVSEANKDTPVWLAHGTADEVVSIPVEIRKCSRQTRKANASLCGCTDGLQPQVPRKF